MNDNNLFDNDVEVQWCPGCPNFSILKSLKKTLIKLDKKPHEICLVSGIGQAAKLPHYLKCNFFNGLHGRALPAATGIAAANPNLTVIVTTGEGDCYGEGGNHFIHALRRNVNITVIVHNNEIYALTKGQASPTTRIGEARSLQVSGVTVSPLNMQAIAISQNCGFVARGFTGEGEQIEELLLQAVKHNGFSFLEIIQPCITWHTHPLKWYKERIRKIDENHDPTDPHAAFKLAMERSETIPTGIIFRGKQRSAFGSRFRENILEGPMAEAPFQDDQTINRELVKFHLKSEQ
jgi:2-oxoglutarate ferredoxin oxidoreductase subunit beta